MTTSPEPNQVLRTWRETHGLTRAQMAGALNDTPTAWHHYILLRCSPDLISKWEAGHIRWPSRKYQYALHDLTGHHPGDLGFPGPGECAVCEQPPAVAPTRPSPAPAETDLTAIDDLTTLAAELNRRGHSTHITTSPPRLTLDSPGLACPQHIHPGHESGLAWFCWHDPTLPYRPAPFSPRSDPLPLTAERASNLIQLFTLIHQALSPSQPRIPYPGPHQQATS
jgi:transcriptional regulator with XRE-family HTH domain